MTGTWNGLPPQEHRAAQYHWFRSNEAEDTTPRVGEWLDVAGYWYFCGFEEPVSCRVMAHEEIYIGPVANSPQQRTIKRMDDQ